MSITTAEIKKVAHLARLAIDESSIETQAVQLSSIFDLVAQMQQVDTSNIEPMAHPFDTPQRLRADTVTETDQHQLFQSIAPQVTAGLYLVPQVIE